MAPTAGEERAKQPFPSRFLQPKDYLLLDQGAGESRHRFAFFGGTISEAPSMPTFFASSAACEIYEPKERKHRGNEKREGGEVTTTNKATPSNAEDKAAIMKAPA